MRAQRGSRGDWNTLVRTQSSAGDERGAALRDTAVTGRRGVLVTGKDRPPEAELPVGASGHNWQ